MSHCPPDLRVDRRDRPPLQGFGWAIAKCLAEAGAEISLGVWVPALNIFETSFRRGQSGARARGSCPAQPSRAAGSGRMRAAGGGRGCGGREEVLAASGAAAAMHADDANHCIILA